MVQKLFDEFGNFNIGNNWELVDLEKIMDDPSSIYDLKINFTSIKHLTIRRNKSVKEGNVDFISRDLFDEWFLYPSLDISNLKNYQNSCVTAIAYWNGINQFSPEDELYEPNGSSFTSSSQGAIEWVDATIKVDGHTTPVLCQVWDGGSTNEYLPQDENADAFDYGTLFIDDNQVEFPVGVFEKSFQKLSWAVVDFIGEGEEGYGLSISCASNGEIVDDPDRDVFDIRIFDILSATEELVIPYVKLYPNITNSYISFEFSDQRPDKIALADLSGIVYKTFEPNVHNTIDVSFLKENDYYVLIFYFKNQIAAKKFYKY